MIGSIIIPYLSLREMRAFGEQSCGQPYRMLSQNRDKPNVCEPIEPIPDKLGDPSIIRGGTQGVHLPPPL